MPPLSSWSAQDTILAAVALVGLAIAVVPAVVSALGMTIIRYRPVADPSASKPEIADEDFESIYEELAAAGFQPLGAVIEEAWLFGHHWYKSFLIHVLRNRDKTVFAAVYRIVPGEPWRVSLETFTDQVAFVRTVMPGAGVEIKEKDYWRREVLQRPLMKLVEEHASHVREHTARYQSAVVEAGLNSRAAMDERLERRQVQSMSGTGHLQPLWIGLIFPALMAFQGIKAIAPALSAPSRYALAAIAGCVVYAILTCILLPFFTRIAVAERNPG